MDNRLPSPAFRLAVGSMFAVLLLASGAPRALALELVPGGYGAGPDAPSIAVPPRGEGQVVSGDAGDSAGLAMDFTPRDGTGFWAGPQSGDPATELHFDLSVSGTPGVSAPELGFGASRDTLRAAQSGSAALAVGGAMHWSDWSLGGGLGRAQIMGTDLDLMSASLGYGRVTAEIALGQSENATVGQPRDVLMLSTDLAAWSWLTLESNLAVGAPNAAEDDRDRSRDPIAAGRLGLRLNF